MKKILFFLISAFSIAQNDNLNSIILDSDIIVQGSVINQNSYFGKNNNIYTDYIIKVNQTLLGDNLETLTISVLGGSVDEFFQHVTHQPKITNYSNGIFFINRVYNSEKLYIKNPDRLIDFNKIEAEKLNNHIQKIQHYFPDFNIAYSNNYEYSTSRSASISSFTPTEVSAGNEDLLTIYGSGFTNIKGKVSFRDADNGGNGYVDTAPSNILSWNDNEINLHVPGSSGTGQFRVTLADGTIVLPPNQLTVLYSILTTNSDYYNEITEHRYKHTGSVPEGIDQSDHLKDGKRIFKMSQELFNNDNMRNSFTTALEDWSCKTGINFTHEGVVSGMDEFGTINKVYLSNFSENGYGGAAFTSTSGYWCRNGKDDTVLMPWKIDIVFDREINWGFGGPQQGFLDFDWGMYHEIGHAATFGHVIDQNNLMHYAYGYQDYYTELDENYAAYGQIAALDGNSPTICSDPMLISECYSNSLGAEKFSSGIHIFYRNNSTYTIISSNSKIESFNLFNISGKLIDTKSFNPPSENINFNMHSLSKGIYFMNIFGKSNEMHTIKFIK